MSLYLKLGTVQSRKTANMLMTIHEYESTNKPVLVIKPARDTRNVGFITTRAGIEKRMCDTFHNETELLNLIEPLGRRTTIFIDEVQFCSSEECEIIKAVSQDFNVLCYGLLSDYTGRTFDAIANLMSEMPSIEWIKSMCSFCDSAAKMNLRMINGEPLYEGNPIIPENEIGKDEYFKVCIKCYHNPPIIPKVIKHCSDCGKQLHRENMTNKCDSCLTLTKVPILTYDVESYVVYQCDKCNEVYQYDYSDAVRRWGEIPDYIVCTCGALDKIRG